MISIIITSFNEPGTIGRAITSFISQNIKQKYELIVSSPDKETLNEALKYAYKNRNIKLIKDKGEGKPSALNLAFKKAKGNILILTDGDVYAGENSVNLLLKHLENSKVGAVTARVVSLNDRDTKYGYWAYLLTETFHRLRLTESKKGKNVICSGYLYALRSNIVHKIPKDSLADDAYISYSLIEKGYQTKYEPRALVHVSYPSNFIDWIKQKKRTASRIYQKTSFNVSKIRSFHDELIVGLYSIFLIKNLRHLQWLISLIFMRLYLWVRIFFDIRLWNRPFKKTWLRIESTK